MYLNVFIHTMTSLDQSNTWKEHGISADWNDIGVMTGIICRCKNMNFQFSGIMCGLNPNSTNQTILYQTTIFQKNNERKVHLISI